jgi:UDP-N-acetylmuramoylalanine--D-glutamate ligase
MQLKDRKVMVAGMARSGVAMARYLLKKGCRVYAYDIRHKEDLGEAVRLLDGPGMVWVLGEDPMKVVPLVQTVFISPGIPIGAPFLQLARRMGIPVVGEVELAYRLLDAPMAAVTGTNGKTTTTALLGEMMRMSGRRTHVVGNIGTPIISVAETAGPEDVVVAEISSFQMESVERFHPKAAAILNITEDHLDRHGSMDVYIAAKARIFENMGGGDVLVLNPDNAAAAALAPRANCRVRYFSRMKETADGAFVRGGMLCLAAGGEVRPVIPAYDIAIPGAHNLENALAAAVMAQSMGADDASIARALRTFQGVEHRLEHAGEVRGVNFINDSKGTNCDASIKAVQAMERPTIILIGGYDKGSGFEPLFEAFTGHIAGVVALGDTKRRVIQDAAAAGFKNIAMADDFKDAVEKAFEMAKPGYNVLLSPASASFDMFTDYEQRGRVFKDIVRQMMRD